MGVENIAKNNPYRSRIEALIKVWSEITSSNRRDWTREEIIDLLMAEYFKRRIEPLRGKVRPPDIFEKELSSLYFIGKYGLGLFKEFPEIFNGPLMQESKIDDILLKMKEQGIGNVRLRHALGDISKEQLIKILRVPFTGVVLGFVNENIFSAFLNKVSSEYPEYEQPITNYKKFYIAFRVAEAIAKGEIRNKLMKEALKRAMAVRIGAAKNLPSDKYIYTIALEVFKTPTKVLKKILSIQERTKNKQGEITNNNLLKFEP